MELSEEIGALLQKYSGDGSIASINNVDTDFDRVAQGAPVEHVSQGLSEAFHSEQTPPFPQMVGHLFGQANPAQRAGMLNQLLSGLAPALASSLLGGLAPSDADREPGRPGTLSPEQAEQVAPEQVERIAAHAERENPGIVDTMSRFYAEHPTLVKALGSAALSILLGKMAHSQS
ncbi:MAG: hypothetical protein ACTHKB_06340 [Burkholderiaceae bacterium]